MSNFAGKYDEGKNATTGNHHHHQQQHPHYRTQPNGPSLIGSDLDMSDGSDMDLEDDESSYASSSRRSNGGGTYGSSYGSHGSAAGGIQRGNSGGSHGGFGRRGSGSNNGGYNGSNSSGSRRNDGGGAKMSPPPSRSLASGGYGAAVPTRNTKKLSLAIGSSVEFGGTTEAPSYDVTESVFIKGDLAINRTGVRMAHRSKTFVVDQSELQLGKIIGRGSSSYVQHAQHVPTGTQVSL
jgi:hypothetical protein